MAYKISNDIEYITYEVQDGDTYQTIASKNGISISELVALNDFNAFDLDKLYIGSILKVGLREKTTGKIVETGIETDDEIEKVFKEAAMQTISVDSITQYTLQSIKEKYDQTGTLSSIKNDLIYLKSLGYTNDEINLLLNDFSVILDLSIREENELSDILERSIDDEIGNYNDTDLNKDTIFGLPFRYNIYADPRRRIYNSTFMTDASVLSIIPGKPLFRGTSLFESDDSGQNVILNLFNGDESTDDDAILEQTKNSLLNGGSDDQILSWLSKSQKNNANNGDLRYYRFQEDYKEFLNYLDLNTATVAVKMGVGDLTNSRFSNFMKNINKDSIFHISHAFKFFCTKGGTSVSESISNSFSDSQLASTMNSLSDAAQEMKFLVGDGEFAKNATQMGQKLIGSVTDMASDMSSTLFGTEVGAATKSIGGAASIAASGNKIIWPQIWKDSNFNRNYSFSFEFVSPYGSPEAIFRFVYLPFLTLLTLASPKQYGTSGYGTPFLIKVDMPGYCTSDLAVIQNISWRKGGSDNLFTSDGLPLAMTVDITVQDLYPNMAIAGSWAQLRHNTGMHAFLDNMAGLSIERFTPWTNIKNSLQIRAVNVLGAVDRTINAGNLMYDIAKSAPIAGSAIEMGVNTVKAAANFATDVVRNVFN